MTSENQKIHIALVSCAGSEQAASLARTLVEEKLVACASLIPQIRSIYHWQGQVQDDTESLLLLKTSFEKLGALESRVLELHSYETPEFVVLEATHANQAYLNWLLSSLS